MVDFILHKNAVIFHGQKCLVSHEIYVKFVDKFGEKFVKKSDKFVEKFGFCIFCILSEYFLKIDDLDKVVDKLVGFFDKLLDKFVDKFQLVWT